VAQEQTPMLNIHSRRVVLIRVASTTAASSRGSGTECTARVELGEQR
jgi:hypothetical protein